MRNENWNNDLKNNNIEYSHAYLFKSINLKGYERRPEEESINAFQIFSVNLSITIHQIYQSSKSYLT